MNAIDLKNWELEAIDYLTNINNKLSEISEAKNLYYGFDIIDGELKENPEILFIGINPGYGDQTRHYEIKFSTDRISYLDFFDNEYSYPLAREIVNVFRLMGLSDDQIISKFKNQCVKSNLYHIITYSDKEIKKCISSAGLKFSDFYHNSVRLCISLISAVKPKIVIFEGKSIYNEIVEGIYEIKGSWDSSKRMGYHYNKVENIYFVGYERMRSNIVNKDIVAAKLKEILIG